MRDVLPNVMVGWCSKWSKGTEGTTDRAKDNLPPTTWRWHSLFSSQRLPTNYRKVKVLSFKTPKSFLLQSVQCTITPFECTIFLCTIKPLQQLQPMPPTMTLKYTGVAYSAINICSLGNCVMPRGPLTFRKQTNLARDRLCSGEMRQKEGARDWARERERCRSFFSPRFPTAEPGSRIEKFDLYNVHRWVLLFFFLIFRR